MGIITKLVEILFPRWCCKCSQYGTLLCAACFSTLDFLSTTSSNYQFLDSVTALTSYNKTTQSLIHALKYQNVQEVAIEIARMLYLYCSIPPTDYLTAVPLHPLRHASRGFNQSSEIAKELSRLLYIPYKEMLVRTVHTKNLASITNKEQRMAIIKNQFCMSNIDNNQVRNTRVLILDDVWTTGATLEEAAKVLKQNGALAVNGLTFTHQR